MLDLLLRNARIVDGTGAPWFRGAVGIEDGAVYRIVRGDTSGVAAEESLDVEDAVVCPGFIDAHSHSDLRVFPDPTLEPKLRQGVTTEVVGQDGLSVAPVSDVDEWRDRMRALAGDAERDWTWGGVAEYLDAVEEAGVAPNVATLVGHGTVRYAVLGMSERSPDEAELEAMAALVKDGLEDGAVGFSSGLVYAPHMHASAHEVQRLVQELRPYGRPFVAHVRGEGRRIWEAMDEFVDIGIEEDVPLHVSHFKLAGPSQFGKVDQLLSLLETARDRGADITADQYPYTAGNTMLTSVLPPWAQTASAAETIETLAEESTRRRIKRQIEEGTAKEWENVAIRVGWGSIVIANVESDENRWMQGESVADISAEEGKDPVDAVCDLLIEESLAVSMFIHHIDRGDMETILQHPWITVATDGLFGENPHPRLYGTYPRVLGHYVRERNHLSLENAVRKMTSLPARAMGLDRKGVVRPGMDADLVVFDPETVAGPATFESPVQFPRGLPHVIVNGEFVVRDFETTGATPGDALRA